MSNCESAETTCHPGAKSGTECRPATAASCCPVEMAAQKWSDSFCRAMTETQVEILKQKIKKSWGAEMEKAGDAVMESMGAQWHAMLEQAKAHAGMREGLKKVFFSGQK